MTIAGTAQVHKSLPAWHRLARAGAAVAAATALLSACGGGDQVKKFQPAQMVSFGDENSALVEVAVGSVGTIKGMKYGVNAVSVVFSANDTLGTIEPDGFSAAYPNAVLLATQTDWVNYPSTEVPGSLALKQYLNGASGQDESYRIQRKFTLNTNFYTDSTRTTQGNDTFDVTYQYVYSCVDSPLWMQILAHNYGLGYNAQCPNEHYYGAVTYAENGATVASVATQVANHRGELGSGTLVTMLAGQNDILDAYDHVKAGTLSLDAAKANMTERGGALALIVNDIIKTGARVLVVKIADLGMSPLAIADGNDGQTRLKALTLAFNNGILNKITNDGQKIVLVPFYDYSNYIKERPADYGFSSGATSQVCASTVYQPDGTAVTGGGSAPLYGGAALLNCNSLTLVGSSATYFWADQTHMSPGAHSYLGSLAVTRAKDSNL